MSSDSKIVPMRAGSSAETRHSPKVRKKTSPDSHPSDAHSRQAILEAAAKIMAAKGYSGTSISMICKAAGCPASSLYWHFESKENLFAEVVHWKSNYFFSLFEPQEGSTTWPEGTMEEIGEQVSRLLQEDPLFLRFLLLLGLERKDMPGEVRKVIVEVRKSARLWWQVVLEKQFSNLGPTVAKLVAEEYAEFGRSVIDGAFFAWDFGDGPDLRRVFRQITMLLSALNEKIAAEEAKANGGADGRSPT